MTRSINCSKDTGEDQAARRRIDREEGEIEDVVEADFHVRELEVKRG